MFDYASYQCLITLKKTGTKEIGLVPRRSAFVVHSLKYLSKLDFMSFGKWCHGPLTRYVKLRTAHAPRMPGTFSPPLTSKETSSLRPRHAWRHVRHVRAVMHAGIANPRWREKRSRHSRCTRNLLFYISGKRPLGNIYYTHASVRPI